mmetsp:Transcript_61767/g.98429  ORF Transcript_61767/g.98429 Transcript_61767/m.98429 type:complete len:462 (+) Transcript_61767:42-1427(+)|eukprot:CAMPEP_0197058404 /NCGR_PEP_ID=MMETSP1384-20130603/107318_1 /TAXON_ID=29189 /ORGANISM="Ammonia sp." /LENGTH=461 /DNA_ID=CAMNT_0042493141 /DNA_START=37 /DNA_END=1422 /DNA_ORIENTATION=-
MASTKTPKYEMETLQAFSSLINMGYPEAASMTAASKYPKDIHKAIDWLEANQHTQPQIEGKIEAQPTPKASKCTASAATVMDSSGNETNGEAEEEAKDEVKHDDNDLQVAIAPKFDLDIKCQCNDCNINNGDKIYICTNLQCADTFYCEACGPFLHRKSANLNRKNHSFTIGSKQVLCVNDLLTIDAHSVSFKQGKDKMIQLLGADKYKQLERAVTFAGTTGAVTLSMNIYAYLNPAFATSSISSAWAGGPAGILVATLVEFGVNALRWRKDEISVKQWLNLTAKSVTRNTAVFLTIKACCAGGCTLGAKGAALGTVVAPGVGTAIGAAGGFVIGIIVGILVGKGVEQLWEMACPTGEHDAKREMLASALNYFHYEKNDIFDESKFNEKRLHKRFKQYSLEVHPDRVGGDYDKFITLSTYYGTLTALLGFSEQEKTKAIVGIEDRLYNQLAIGQAQKVKSN